MNVQGGCDDGSDESFASSSVAQQPVLKGTGRFAIIVPETIQVSLPSAGETKSFKFSFVWKLLRLVMELTSGRRALTNISFLVSKTALASEDMLHGLPILQHLRLDSHTILNATMRHRMAQTITLCRTPSCAKRAMLWAS